MASQPLSRRRQRRLGSWLLAGGAVLALRSWNLVPLEWTCPLRQFTGLPCPACFLTRSLLAGLRGDWAVSLHWHPLGLPLLLGAGLVTAALLAGWLPQPRRLLPLGVGAGGLLLGVWLIRLWGWSRGVPLPG